MIANRDTQQLDDDKIGYFDRATYKTSDDDDWGLFWIIRIIFEGTPAHLVLNYFTSPVWIVLLFSWFLLLKQLKLILAVRKFIAFWIYFLLFAISLKLSLAIWWLIKVIFNFLISLPWLDIIEFIVLMTIVGLIILLFVYIIFRIWLKVRQGSDFDYNIFDDPKLSTVDKLTLKSLDFEVPVELSKKILSYRDEK